MQPQLFFEEEEEHPSQGLAQASIPNGWEQLPVLHLLITAGITLGDIRLLRVQRVSEQLQQATVRKRGRSFAEKTFLLQVHKKDAATTDGNDGTDTMAPNMPTAAGCCLALLLAVHMHVCAASEDPHTPPTASAASPSLPSELEDPNLPPQPHPSVAPSLPNIVLVLVDELGTGDVPWFDRSIHAPTIQALGEGGLRTWALTP